MALKGDFIGFTFNGRHSSELGIIRTSDGSRYNSELLPSFNDNTVAVPGGDGTYYFGSYYNQKPFPIQFATDELDEVQFRQLRQWLGDKGIHDLIFDEAPYKVYSAKIAAVPNFNYICFDEGTNHRTYKGEGTIQFVCYYPFARSRWKGLNQVPSNIDSTEWAAASGIPTSAPTLSGTDISLYNPGDLDTDIKIIVGIIDQSGSSDVVHRKFYLGGSEKLKIMSIEAEDDDTYIRINSASNLIEGGTLSNQGIFIPSGNLYNKYITEGDFFKIPAGADELGLYCYNQPSEGQAIKINLNVEYDYLYY